MEFRRWLVLAALVVGSCSGSDAEPVPNPTPFRTAIDPEAQACRTAGGAARARPSGPVTGADVDGNGSLERVYTVDLERGPRGCTEFVVVAGEDATRVAPGEEFDPVLGLSAPAVAAAVPIDERAGAEVVVDVAAGASSRLVAIYTLLDGRLQRVRIDVPPDLPPASIAEQFPDLVAYGGSLGHLDAVDCTDGAVVVSSARPDPRGRRFSYSVHRYFYEPEGAVWRLIPQRTQEVSLPLEQVTERFEEFVSSPFGACTR